MTEYPVITAHRVLQNTTEYLVKWDPEESTWERKQDIENSSYKSLLKKYTISFAFSGVPQKIIGKSIVDNRLYVRWMDGTYAFTDKMSFLDEYPELAI